MGRYGTTKHESLRHIVGTPYFNKARKIDRNTYRYECEDDGGNVFENIRLHKTDIITRALRVAETSFSTGGWRTNTTKERLNKFAPKGFSFWSEKGVFFITSPLGEKFAMDDGITFDYEGRCISGHHAYAGKNGPMPVDEEIRRLIVAYMAKVRKAGKYLPVYSDTDCWLCASEEGMDPDLKMDNQHILTHLIEGTLDGSLLRNALNSRGNYTRYQHYLDGSRRNLRNISGVHIDVRWYLKRRLIGRVSMEELNALRSIHADLSMIPGELDLATVAT